MRFSSELFTPFYNQPEPKRVPPQLQKIMLGIFIAFALLVIFLESLPALPQSALVLRRLAFCRMTSPDTVQYTNEFTEGEMIYLCGEAEFRNWVNDAPKLDINIYHSGQSDIITGTSVQLFEGVFRLEVTADLPPGQYDLSVIHVRNERLEKTIVVK